MITCAGCKKRMRCAVTGVHICDGKTIIAADEFVCPGCGQTVWANYAAAPIATGKEAAAAILRAPTAYMRYALPEVSKR